MFKSIIFCFLLTSCAPKLVLSAKDICAGLTPINMSYEEADSVIEALNAFRADDIVENDEVIEKYCR